MDTSFERRTFLKGSVAGITSLGFEDAVLRTHLAQAAEPKPTQVVPASFPKGKIGGIEISRVICGGNLISGYAHSRDLIYVSPLLEHYFTDEKIFETFRQCEAQGINTAMLKHDAKTMRLLNTYWHERGGSIQWIAQITTPDKLSEEVRQAVDSGAVGVFTTGQMGDALVRAGKIELLAKTVAYIQASGVIAGISCHELAVVTACEKAGIKPDFFMKTFNSKNYWSASNKEHCDNVFNDEAPEETAAFMKNVDRPWVAFKVLGAGAIQPKDGFEYAFKNGADFICVGMFDFQVAEDAALARQVLDGVKERERAWRA